MICTDGKKVLPDNKTDAIIQDDSITDCNNCFETGKVKTYIVGDISNLPDNKEYYILSFCNDTTWSGNKYITQIATYASNYNDNKMFIRHAYLLNGNRAWTAWKEL